jgi:hypothetical protein
MTPPGIGRENRVARSEAGIRELRREARTDYLTL